MRPPRDPMKRLWFFCEILAVGLVGAAILLKFPNHLESPGSPAVPLDYFPGFLENAAFALVHTRAIWIALAVCSTVAAAMGRFARSASRRSGPMMLAILAMLLVIALHAGALAWLGSKGSLVIELRQAAPAAIDNAVQEALSSLPAATSHSSIHAESVTRFVVREGTAPEWKLLVAGDFLFCVPGLFAWLLSAAGAKSKKPL